MLVGYMRVSSESDRQTTDLQRGVITTNRRKFCPGHLAMVF